MKLFQAALLGLIAMGVSFATAGPSVASADHHAAEPTTPAAAAGAKQIAEVANQAFEPLPGRHGYLFTQLTPEGPQTLYQQHADERFAIGSSFKLFILGTLAEEANAGQRRLANVFRLREPWIGPPHSELAEWPLGSPVTLQTLALKMISISDNTATDHLIHILGRENIEHQMARMGHEHPQWNTPLLTTRDMVMLRDKNTGNLGREYLKLDVAARRQMLAKLQQQPIDFEQVDFDTAAYDLAEWYACPEDMARALAWIKQHTGERDAAHPLRAVLAVEPKLKYDPEVWPYVGFKGGSEDQLLAGNWLLRHKNGNWYTMHVWCNSPDKKLPIPEMVTAVQTLFAAIEKELE